MTGRTLFSSLTLTAALLGGCAAVPSAPPSVADAPPVAEADASGGWRATATDQDRGRIRGWYSSWQRALADGRAKGFGSEIDKEGVLLQPMAALPNAHLPAGEYKCRTIKLGAQPGGALGYTAYGWFDCRVDAEQGIFSLTKLTGSQRPVGLIFPDNLKRQIFLGTLVLGIEAAPLNYGTDRMRDMAGLIERVGEARWRLVLPEPAYESMVDVIEIVPAG